MKRNSKPTIIHLGLNTHERIQKVREASRAAGLRFNLSGEVEMLLNKRLTQLEKELNE